MQGQQDLFDERMAKYLSDASEQQAHSCNRLAEITLDASDMKAKYKQLERDNALLKEAVVQVSLLYPTTVEAL